MNSSRRDPASAFAPAANPFVREQDGAVSLHFEIEGIQSQMRLEEPDQLVLGYTRTMMAFLLLNHRPKSIAMIGLGGGSLAKYCRRYLPQASITVVEIAPEVIALRERFFIPPDDEKFQVVCADGADFTARAPQLYDVLIVDGFDATGQPEQLCTQEFYDNCYRCLTARGVLVVNLCDFDMGAYTTRIRRSFHNQILEVYSEDGTNKIVFAGKGGALLQSEAQFFRRLRQVECHHPIDFSRVACRMSGRQGLFPVSE